MSLRFGRKIRSADSPRAGYLARVTGETFQEARYERGRVIAALLALYFIWGSTYLAIRLALPGFPPLMMSGLRFVHQARQVRIPVAIVSRGATRGDLLADIKVDAALGEVLPTLAGAPHEAGQG